MVAINAKHAPPQTPAGFRCPRTDFGFPLNPTCKKSSQEDKSFGCRDITDKLVGISVEAGGQMGAGHPDQQETAEGIQLGQPAGSQSVPLGNANNRTGW